MEAAIDAVSLREIRELDPDGSAGLLVRVLGSYVESLEVEVRAIASAIASGDIEEVARGAHKLQSSSASVGARRVARLASELEAAAREARGADSARLTSELTGEAERALPELRALIRDSADAG